MASRHVEAERMCSLQVDGQLEFSRLLDWKRSRLGTPQNLADIPRGARKMVRKVGAVGHQATGLHKFPRLVYCQQFVGSRGPDRESLAPESSVGARGRRRRASALLPANFFLMVMAVASKKSGKRAAAAWDSPLVKRRNDLIQREVRFLADEGKDLPRVLLQWRSTPSTGHGFESPVFTKALHPPDRRTDADIKLFGRLTSGSSFFHEVDDARSQLTRIRSMHWAALRRINALDSHLRRVLGIPIHCGRDVL